MLTGHYSLPTGDIGVGAGVYGGSIPSVLNSGGIIPPTFQAKLREKLRNMAAIELQTQLEYNATTLSVNDFDTGSSNRKEIMCPLA